MADGGKTFDAFGHQQASRAQPRDPRALPRLVRNGVGLARRASPRLFALLIACQVATAGLLAVQVVLGKLAIEEILTGTRDGRDLSGAIIPVLGLAAATALAGFVAAAVQQLQRDLGERVTQLTWRSILDVTSAVDLEVFEDPDFFDDVQRVMVNAVIRPLTMTTGLAQVISGLLSSTALGFALVLLAPLLVPALVLAAFPMALLSRRSGRLEFTFISRQTPALRVRDYLQTVLTGRAEAQEIRAFDLGGPLRDRWAANVATYLRALDRHVLGRLRLALLSAGVTAISTAVSLGILLWMLSSDRLSLASAAAALFAVRTLGSQLQTLFSGVTQLFESGLFLADFERFLQRVPEPKPVTAVSRAPVPPLDELVLEDVGFTYPGSDRPALRGVDLVLRRGETVALVGANGSGKTTLAKLIAQLFDPVGGRLLWNGVDVAELDRSSLRAAVGVIFQNYVRYELSAGDNIAMGRVDAAGDSARMEQAARRGGAHQVIASLPDGYDTQLGKQFSGGYDLSGGQWQRVALSRAFFRDAELLVLDEPTAALDARAEHEIFEQVRDLAAGKTLLLISHRFSTVKSADRIYVLDGGAVLEQGSHDELMAAGGRYAELFDLQASAYR